MWSNANLPPPSGGIKQHREQLENYLGLSAAAYGILHYPEQTFYYRKIVDGNQFNYREIPDIPAYGQDLNDVGNLRFKDLHYATNLAAEFQRIRNIIAGSAKGNLSHEGIARDIIALLFCKIHDERTHEYDNDLLSFRRTHEDSHEDVYRRVQDLLDQLKSSADGTILKGETISLDAGTVASVVSVLQRFRLINSQRDAIASSFEVFVGPALAGDEGQFFTPRVVVKAMVEMLGVSDQEQIIDPACGSGGFLTVALGEVSQQLEDATSDVGSRTRRISQFAGNNLVGVDKNTFLARVAQTYMALVGDGRTGIVCDDSLLAPEKWDPPTKAKVGLGTFDVVLTNPPFGKNLKVTDEVLEQYELARERKVVDGKTVLGQKIVESPPQILFIERCLALLKPGGRLGIVLPEGLFGNRTQQYIFAWLRGRAHIQAIVSLPNETFKISGKQGTSTRTQFLLAQKFQPPKDRQTAPIFMAIASRVGHDSRGNLIESNDLDAIVQAYRTFRSGGCDGLAESTGFTVSLEDTVAHESLICRRYDPRIRAELRAIGRADYDIVRLGDLIAREEVQDLGSSRSDMEIKKHDYALDRIGTWETTIPFIRTSDIANNEIVVGNAERVKLPDAPCEYEPGDILFVQDGDKLVGATAIVSPDDLPFALQSHFRRFRVMDGSALSPHLLLALLNSKVVKMQIRSLIVIQSTLGTIGRRYQDLMLPVPNAPAKRRRIADAVTKILAVRTRKLNEFTALTKLI